MNIHITPLPAAFLHRVRAQETDDQGQPVQRRRAQGGEPCRDVLRRAHPGEEILLASFCPFALAGPYKEYGPVFVLASAAEEEVDRHALPLPRGQAADYFASHLALRAYSGREEIADARLVEASQAAAVLEGFLAAPGTAFIHARFPAYGCFACRIEATA